MKLPDFVYVKAFWEGFASVLAGVLFTLVALGKLDPQWAWGSGAILTFVLGVLKAFKIEPQLMERRARLLAESKKAAKKSK